MYIYNIQFYKIDKGYINPPNFSILLFLKNREVKIIYHYNNN